jgi:hypothetical protein
LSYGSFILALVHGIASGTDSGASWIQAMYWVAGSSLLFMFFYRLMAAVFKVKKERRVPSTTVK